MKTKHKYKITKFIKYNLGLSYVFISRKYNISISDIQKYVNGSYRFANVEETLLNIGVPQHIIEEHFLEIQNNKHQEVITKKNRSAKAYIAHLDEIRRLEFMGISLRSIWKIINSGLKEEETITYNGFRNWYKKINK